MSVATIAEAREMLDTQSKPFVFEGLSVKDFAKLACIYQVELLNGKNYIGQSKTILSRLAGHLRSSRAKKIRKHLYRAMKVHGFRLKLLAVYPLSISKVDFDDIENYYIAKYDSLLSGNGYNLRLAGQEGFFVSRKKRGVKKRKMSVAERTARGIAGRGRVMSAEARRNMSIGSKRSKKARKATLANLAKMQSIPKSDASRKKMSISQKSRVRSDEEIALFQRGNNHRQEEVKEMIRKAKAAGAKNANQAHLWCMKHFGRVSYPTSSKHFHQV